MAVSSEKIRPGTLKKPRVHFIFAGTPPPSTGTMGTDRSPSPPYNAGPPDKSRENSMGRTSMYDYGDSEESEGEESEVAEIHEEPR